MELIILIILGVIDLAFQIYLISLMKDKPLEYSPKTEEKPHKDKLNEEQKKKQEELRKSFENLMGYGYEDALKKKE